MADTEDQLATPLTDQELAEAIAVWSDRDDAEKPRVLRMIAELQKLRLRCALRDVAVGMASELIRYNEEDLAENARLRMLLITIRSTVTGRTCDSRIQAVRDQEIVRLIDQELGREGRDLNNSYGKEA